MRCDLAASLQSSMSRYELSMTQSVDQRLRAKVTELSGATARELETVQTAICALKERASAIGADVVETRRSIALAKTELLGSIVFERDAVVREVDGMCRAAAKDALKSWSLSDWPSMCDWLKRNVTDAMDVAEGRLLTLNTDTRSSVEDVSGNVTVATRRSDTAFALAEWCSNAFATGMPPPQATTPEDDAREAARSAGRSNALVTYLDSENKPVLRLMDELYYPPFATVPPLVESPCKSGIGLWSRSTKGGIVFYAGSDRVGLPVERMRVSATGLDVRGRSTFEEVHEQGVSLCEKYVSQETYNALIEELITKKILESRLSVTTLFSPKSTTIPT
jgi:hypothetical protein